MKWMILLSLTLLGTVYAASPFKQASKSPAIRDNDYGTTINGNDLDMFVTNRGWFGYDYTELRGQKNGLYYPNDWPEDSRTLLYCGGLWLGAQVNDELRMAVSEYSSEYVPGGVDNVGAPLPDGPHYRVYRIEQGETGTDDYLNWPADQGAPMNSAGSGPWIEDIPTATQMTFSVFNDADPNSHWSTPGGTDPLHAEVRHTAWTLAGDAEEHIIRMQYEIINRSDDVWENFQAALWLDPDLGDAVDDLIGSDTLLYAGFCYNGDDEDSVYDPPPAVGLQVLHGLHVPSAGDSAWYAQEWHPGERNLPMTACIAFANGYDPQTAQDGWFFMQGLNRDGTAMVHPLTGETTTHMYTGDPVFNEGWRDDESGDRRMLISCGPVNLGPGESQEITVAIIVGQGNSRLESVQSLQATARYLQCRSELGLVAVSPLHFIHVNPGSSEQQTLMMINPTDEDFILSDIRFSSSEFSIIEELPWVVYADIENYLPVEFTPTSLERIEAWMEMVTGNENTVRRIPVSGNGPWLQTEPGLINFGEVNNNPVELEVILSNPGTEDLNIQGMQQGLPVTMNPEELILPPGGSRDITLTLTPDALGDFRHWLQLQDNIPGTNPLIQLRWTTNSFWQMGLTWEFDNRPFTGVDWGGQWFFGSMDYGRMFFGSTLPEDHPFPDRVELRFDLEDTTLCQTYRRDLTYPRGGVGRFPGSAWDLNDPENPRRLNICFVEHDQLDEDSDGTIDYTADLLWWLHEGALGGRQYFFIMNSTYDSTPENLYGNGDWNGDGTIDPNLDIDGNGTLDPWDGEDTLAWGPAADVLFAGWIRLREGHAFTELLPGDYFAFTNTHYEGIAEPGSQPETIPADIALLANYPNPFNAGTTITLSLGRAQRVDIEVYNLLGEKVIQLASGYFSAGLHQVNFSGGQLASGVYVCTASTETVQVSRKMLLLK